MTVAMNNLDDQSRAEVIKFQEELKIGGNKELVGINKG